MSEHREDRSTAMEDFLTSEPMDSLFEWFIERKYKLVDQLKSTINQQHMSQPAQEAIKTIMLMMEKRVDLDREYFAQEKKAKVVDDARKEELRLRRQKNMAEINAKRLAKQQEEPPAEK